MPGAALRINDAGREHGQIRAFNNRTFDVTKAVPTVVMRNEDYGRIARLMASGRVVEIEATIVNQTYPEGRTQHNVIAEIPGTDKAQEVVMLGGHLDSWHAATGATDNAIGVGDDVRGDPHPAGDRREAAAHHPPGAVERRGTGPARLGRLRRAALRHVRERRSRSTNTSPATSTSTRAPARRAG